MLKYSQETDQRFSKMEVERIEILVNTDVPTGHQVVTSKFVERLINGSGEVIAEGPEGIHSLTLANGIMLSSFQKQTVEAPINADAYEVKLKDLILTSKFVKNATAATSSEEDMSKSFSS
jgi:hypothetical protein